MVVLVHQQHRRIRSHPERLCAVSAVYACNLSAVTLRRSCEVLGGYSVVSINIGIRVRCAIWRGVIRIWHNIILPYFSDIIIAKRKAARDQADGYYLSIFGLFNVLFHFVPLQRLHSSCFSPSAHCLHSGSPAIEVSRERMPARTDADATAIQLTSPRTADVPIVATAV